MKGYRDNGGAGGGFGARNKTVYDDVFGGPPKFGATTLPPRLEDYTEIFQGFHASRGSSIPVLDLPPPSNDSDDVWFDVQSSKLDYSEVFGGFHGLDFAVSYEELFKSSKVVDGDSSDDVWTPAQSESLSDELDPYASLEMNQHVSTSDPIELFGVKLQKGPHLEEENDLLNGITSDSQFLDVPCEIENEKLFSLANNDHSSSNHIVGKRLKKSLSQPLDSVCDTERYRSDQKAYHMGNKPHLSVSDLSLKTQPSNLPPPSRPPPVLSAKKGDTGCFSSKLKTSKSYAFEKMRDDRSPPYFDVEIDASSSAAADAAAMKDAVEQAQAKLRSAKELMDRKKEGLQSRSKMQIKNKVGGKMENVNEDERSNGFGGKNKKIPLESFEQKDDFKNVQESEVCGFEVNNERQETLDASHRGHEHIKEPTLAQNTCNRGAETSFVVSQQHGETKLPSTSEADEHESYDNLIEIQLKDNDMEHGVKLVEENYKNTPYDWEDYGEACEKEHEKELKESKEQDATEVQQSSPPEIVITQSEEDDDHENKEFEGINEDPFNWEESENKEETMNHNEKILQEEDEIKAEEGFEQTLNDDVANEEIETIHEMDSNSEENKELQKNHEREEESEKREEVVSENIVIEKEEELTEEDELVDQVEDNETNKATPQTPSSSCLKPNDLQGEKIEVRNTHKVNEETSMEDEKKKMEREKLEREREIERKLEEERERQIEREKDRMAIDRATIEARERAFSETKERTERAAVERATAEFRQRALAEARERLEKACAEARERSLADKAMEGRLRVEKATAEARERAERSVDDKFSSSRSMGLRYPQNAAPYNGGEGESPQRCKARLERHQRTADRAAKALAEKNMRDLLAQKEQAEINRLAEGLDAEVKRWCGGKQGNLRALLSTLQYILGPDSGWQPVPLTEVITTAAVKKAYRKATLCVHPDKLQQRGATIQQKYICEKVFDLLKEAWNKFNSEER